MAFSISPVFHVHLRTPYNVSFLLTDHPRRSSLTLQTSTSLLHRKSNQRSRTSHVSENNWPFEQRMEEALNVLDLMEAQGMQPDPNLICILLKSCTEAESLEFGKTIHSRIIGTKLDQDVYVVNNLISLYAKCGCLKSARKVFDEMPHRNEVTWTTMISIYSQRGLPEEALGLYSMMKYDSRVRPNAFTYSVALNLCAKLRNLKKGVEVHEDVVKDKCENDEFVVTALIDMYSKCGKIDSAVRVFVKVEEPTIAACTAMLDGYNNNGQAKEAISLIRRILHQGLDIKVVRELGFVCMIRSCIEEGAFRQGQEFHAHIIKFGYELGPQILRALVLLYLKCDKMMLAQPLFDKLGVKNEDLCSKMISGYVRNGMNHEALELYSEMVCVDIKPCSFVVSCALKACVSLLGQKEGNVGASSQREGREILGHVIKLGNGVSGNSLLATLVKLYDDRRFPEEAQSVTKYQRGQR